MQRITLQIPPSINHLYGRARNGYTFMSKRGKDWFEDSLWRIKGIPHEKTIYDPVKVHIELFCTAHRDVDNILKALLDLVSKHAKLIDNDSQVHELFIRKNVVHKRDLFKVTIEISKLVDQ